MTKEWIIKGSAAGLHLVAALSSGGDETQIVSTARSRGVGLYPMSMYRRSWHSQNETALVFGYGHLNEVAIEHGLRRAFGNGH